MIIVIFLIALSLLIAAFTLLYFSVPKFKSLVESPKYRMLEQEERFNDSSRSILK